MLCKNCGGIIYKDECTKCGEMYCDNRMNLEPETDYQFKTGNTDTSLPSNLGEK